MTININGILDCTDGIGIVRFLNGSSVSQELGNIQSFEKWNVRLNIYKKYSDCTSMSESLTKSMYICKMGDNLIASLIDGVRRLHNLENEWDDFGLIESAHDDDPREDDENWVDDRLDLIHAVYYRKNRDIVVWVITDIRTSNVTAQIQPDSNFTRKTWWKFWK